VIEEKEKKNLYWESPFELVQDPETYFIGEREGIATRIPYDSNIEAEHDELKTLFSEARVKGVLGFEVIRSDNEALLTELNKGAILLRKFTSSKGNEVAQLLYPMELFRFGDLGKKAFFQYKHGYELIHENKEGRVTKREWVEVEPKEIKIDCFRSFDEEEERELVRLSKQGFFGNSLSAT
jgi:hypothetical protein